MCGSRLHQIRRLSHRWLVCSVHVSPCFLLYRRSRCGAVHLATRIEVSWEPRARAKHDIHGLSVRTLLLHWGRLQIGQAAIMHLDDDLRVIHLILLLRRSRCFLRALSRVALQGRHRLLVAVKLVLAYLDAAEALILLVTVLNEVTELTDGLIIKAIAHDCGSRRVILILLVSIRAIDRSSRVPVASFSPTDSPL